MYCSALMVLPQMCRLPNPHLHCYSCWHLNWALTTSPRGHCIHDYQNEFAPLTHQTTGPFYASPHSIRPCCLFSSAVFYRDVNTSPSLQKDSGSLGCIHGFISFYFSTSTPLLHFVLLNQDVQLFFGPFLVILFSIIFFLFCSPEFVF